jgi:hypothetical protein
MSPKKIVGTDGFVEYILNGYWHREDGPAIQHANGDKYWYLNGSLHREDGPAVEKTSGHKAWFINGKEISEQKFLELQAEKHRTIMGISPDLALSPGSQSTHNTNRVLSIKDNGDITWHANNLLHRDDGPAWYIRSEKAYIWFKDSKRHRTDGPAYESSIFGKSWWINGKRHRTDGPAIIDEHGNKQWWIDGLQLSEEEFNKKMSTTKDIVAGTSGHLDPNTPVKSVEELTGDIHWKLPNGQHHREDGPAFEKTNGYRQWCLNGKIHREDGAAIIDQYGGSSYYLDGKEYTKVKFDELMKTRPRRTVENGFVKYILNGALHREDGPAFEKLGPTGFKQWYKNGKSHRLDGPAHEGVDGSKVWWVDGNVHREDGPASIQLGGAEVWYLNGVMLTKEQHQEKMKGKPTKKMHGDGKGYEYHLLGLFHREDGPAIVYADGSQFWYLNGKCHRVDGPAAITASGEKTWYLDGKRVTEQQFKARVKYIPLKSINGSNTIEYKLPNGQRHREDGPALEYSNGEKHWYYENQLHRVDGPAVEFANGVKAWHLNGLAVTEAEHKVQAKSIPTRSVSEDGTVKWFLDGKLHNLRGPACIYPNGRTEWYRDNLRHREGGPSVEDPSGLKEWHQNGRYHRVDGPAYISSAGDKAWFVESRRHREDGPAIERTTDGGKEWWIDNLNYTEPQYIEKMKTYVRKTVDSQGVTRYLLNGELHRLDGPAKIDKNGDQYWYKNGKLNRDDGPAIEKTNGEKHWYQMGLRHRVGGPAAMLSNGDNGWWLNGKFHREDGPAIERKSDGVKEWYLNGTKFTEATFNEAMKLKPVHSISGTTEAWSVDGKYHRVDGPAYIENGNKHWYINGLHHRDDGPAYEGSNGDKSWWVNGKRHRTDGPARDLASGTKEWFIDGVQFTEALFKEKMKTTPIRSVSNGVIKYTLDGKYHRDNGPAVEDKDCKLWYKNGVLHRDGGPAIQYTNGEIQWVKNGKIHREDGPAIISGERSYWYLDNLNLTEAQFNERIKEKNKPIVPEPIVEMKVNDVGTIYYKLGNKYHREDGPAIEHKDGKKEWFIDGIRHRTDGPAYENPASKCKEWFINGIRHRDGGPAIETATYAHWYKNGKLHREDGPAADYNSGSKQWFLDGIEYTEADFKKKTGPKSTMHVDGEGNEIWSINGIIHREDGPAVEYVNGDKTWYHDGKIHRSDGPAYEGADGTKTWYSNGQFHRVGGPAHEGAAGNKAWWIRGKRHRLDGPARILIDENKNILQEWHIDGIQCSEEQFKEAILPKKKQGLIVDVNGDSNWYKDNLHHKEDGPAYISKNGDKQWAINGKLHREDGPAIENIDGSKYWYLNGVGVSEKEFLATIIKPKEKKEDTKMANVSFMDRIKEDVEEAGYRVAATQFTAAVKGGILLLFKDKGFDDSKLAVLKEMLESEFGTAMVSALLGYGLVYMPKLKEDPRVVKLSKEFRVNGVATAGNEIMSIGFQYMMPALTQAMESLPPLQEVVPPVLRKKTGKKRVHVEPSAPVLEVPVNEEKSVTA